MKYELSNYFKWASQRRQILKPLEKALYSWLSNNNDMGSTVYEMLTKSGKYSHPKLDLKEKKSAQRGRKNNL